LFKTAPLCGIFIVQVRSINRHRDLVTGEIVKGANKLTKELLDQFDEIWFFGFLQTNTLETAENELGNDEVFNLRVWMDAGGGVFVTGDHASPDPRFAPEDPRNKDHQTYLGLGRALGHRIPRAGRLRAWEGPPTADVSSMDLERRDNYNTLVGNVKDLDDAVSLQTDAIGQELILPGKIPHRLFWLYLNPDKSITPITKFPDHMHEGKLLIPDPLDGDWPTTERKPTIVARGRDNRPFEEKRTYPLVIAYDGHVVLGSTSSITLGRIVADSSFHHYVNTNLVGFERDVCGNPPVASTLDQIAQYFANLALWLAPQQVHDQVKQGLIHLLGNHPQILEVRGNNIFSLGRTALAILSNFGDLILNQLFNLSHHPQPRVVDMLLSLLFLGRSGSIEINEKERTEALGLLVRLLHQRFSFEELIERKTTPDGLATLSSLETELKRACQASSVSELLITGEGTEAFLRAGLESAN